MLRFPPIIRYTNRALYTGHKILTSPRLSVGYSEFPLLVLCVLLSLVSTVFSPGTLVSPYTPQIGPFTGHKIHSVKVTVLNL